MTTRRFLILLLLIAAMAPLLVLLATRHGVGLANDSTTYITEARQLVRGHGLTTAQGTPVTHFPPLFPIVIAAPGVVGIDAIPAARALNLALLAASILLIGWIVYRCTNRSALAGLLAGGLAAVSNDLLALHAWAMSEPLFLFTMLSGLWVLSRQQRREGLGSVALAGLLIAMACLTRYAGISLIFTGAVTLLGGIGRPVRQRLKAAVLFVAIAGLPSAGWMLRNHFVAGTATNRQVIYHPVGPQKLSEGAQTIAAWFGPALSPAGALVIIGIALIGLIGAVLLHAARAGAGRQSSIEIPWAFGLMVPFYLAFLFISLCFFDAQIPLDSRLLAPVPAVLICFAIPLLTSLLKPVLCARRGARSALMTALCLWLVCFAYRDMVWVRQTRRSGLGYASREWHSSRVIAEIRRLPDDVCIYSNAPGAVLLLADHITGDLPQKYDRNSTLPKADYQSRMDLMRQQMTRYGGYLAYFRRAGSRHNLPGEEELKSAIPLQEQIHDPDASLYRSAPP